MRVCVCVVWDQGFLGWFRGWMNLWGVFFRWRSPICDHPYGGWSIRGSGCIDLVVSTFFRSVSCSRADCSFWSNDAGWVPCGHFGRVAFPWVWLVCWETIVPWSACWFRCWSRWECWTGPPSSFCSWCRAKPWLNSAWSYRPQYCFLVVLLHSREWVLFLVVRQSAHLAS